MSDFHIIPHTADLKIRVFGNTMADLFRNALIGMFQAIKPIAPQCKVVNDRLVCPTLPEKHSITLQAPDRDALLVDFLSEALYLSDVYNQAFLDATFSVLTDTSLQAEVFGINIQGFDVVEIKAVTYHDLAIKHVDGQWQADIVFDI